MAVTRRSITNRRPEILADFEWLVEREDEEGFLLWLKCHGLVEGSEPYERACEAWQGEGRPAPPHPEHSCQ